jgi:putative addiction module component (TIGR02574 family)
MATRAQLVEELLQLSSADRALAARDLLQSLDGEGDAEEAEAAWQEEVERRIHEIDQGSVELLDGPRVMREARARLQARRRSKP